MLPIHRPVSPAAGAFLRNAGALFLAGFVLGPVGDALHVLTNTTMYPSPGPVPGWPQPLWVPALFGTAALAIGLPHLILRRPTAAAAPPMGRALLGLVLLLGYWGLTGWLPGRAGEARDLLLLALAVAAAWIFDRRPLALGLAALTGAAGTVAECLLIRAGLFAYTEPHRSWAGAPVWLPLLYFTASIAIGHFALALLGRAPPGRAGVQGA